MIAPINAPSFRLHHFLATAAQDQPDAVGLIDEHGTGWTFQTWLERTEGVRQALEANGLQGGDRFMIIAENGVDLTCLLMACWMLDAW
ncbi:MAG: AMP-binding protein, partial [Pseudomonadota bacterium]